MLIRLSHHNPLPLYEQITAEIRRKIIAGELRGGDPLPSIRQLAADLTTSVITTKRAYQELEQEGLIYTRPGMGSFVAEGVAGDQQSAIKQELRQQLRLICQMAKAGGMAAETLAALLNEIIDEGASGDGGVSY